MFGLEIRTPFLDHNLVQTINSIPSYLKYDNHYRKLLLRRVGEKFIDKRIIWNNSKIAFSFPINEILKKGFLNSLYKGMFKDGLELENVYHPDGLIKLLHHHENGHDHSNTLWRILCLEYWLRYMNNRYT